MDNSPDIYKLGLHGQMWVTNYVHVMRVPGGWIYTTKDRNENRNSVFVPYNEEFKDGQS